MSRWSAVLAAMTIAVVVSAPTARADYTERQPQYTLPVIAGSRLVFLEIDSHENATVRSTAFDGSDPRTLHELDGLFARKRPAHVLPEYAMDASAQRVVGAMGWADPNAEDIGPDADISLIFSEV